MKLTELDLQAEGKKYFCKEVNEIFKVREGNLTTITRSFSIAELLKLDFEEVKETKNPYERVEQDELYYNVAADGRVRPYKDINDGTDYNLFNSLNYFNNKNYAEYVSFKETLTREMDKFAWENNARVIDWERNSKKYYITFDIDIKNLVVYWRVSHKSNDIYFTSKEIAKKALEKFKDDLIKLYTWQFDF